MSVGHFVSINQRLDAEIIQMIAEEFGFEVEFATAEDTTTIAEIEDKSEDLKDRLPGFFPIGKKRGQTFIG